MRLADSEELARFRASVTSSLTQELPPGWDPAAPPLEWDERLEVFGHTWEARLKTRGLNGVSWPQEFGGRGLGVAHEVVILEELAVANVPESINYLAKTMLAPTLLVHGSSEQRQRILPTIIDGSEVWCQGFSEPNAGSDLANVRLRAERVDGGFRLFGQKTWTTYAQVADWMFAIARSDPASDRHRGLSFVLVSLRQPGVEVRPIRQIDGNAEFNEVFFDGALVTDDNLIGAEGAGWTVAMTMLGAERGMAHVGRYVRFNRQLDEMIAFARTVTVGDRTADLRYADALATFRVEIETYRLLTYRLLSEMQGGVPGPSASIVKLFWTEMLKRMQALALEIAGESSVTLVDPAEHPPWGQRYLAALSRSLAGGTSEIQRNIVAEQLLGLPR